MDSAWNLEDDVLKTVLSILQDSFVPNSDVQKHTQAQLASLQGNPAIFQYFLYVMENPLRQFDDQTRALAGLLLKNNLPQVFEQNIQLVATELLRRCLHLLMDPSKDVRSTVASIITTIALKGGVDNWPELFGHLGNLIDSPQEEIRDSAVITLSHICEDYLNLEQHSTLNESILKVLEKFLVLAEHSSRAIKKHCFKILNEVVQNYYNYVKGDICREYLLKLIASANDSDDEIVISVCQGFISYINNQDPDILPYLENLIEYMLLKTTDGNEEIALQACEFWFSLSRLPNCKDILSFHLPKLIPILLRNMRQCPKHLLGELIKIVIEEVRKNCKKDPLICGFNPNENAYEPLKLMQSVILQVNEVCLRYLDNSMLCSLPSPGSPFFITSDYAIRNRRRAMEDRHVVIHDLNSIFNDRETSPSSYYAVFDGHDGHHAAAYSATHFHQYLAESKHFRDNPKQALIDAFERTDTLFLEKCKAESFNSGTTAICSLVRHKEKKLLIAWVGDSQAILSRRGRVTQCVNPHKPNRKDERDRIQKNGGEVIFWYTWRVNGLLAVSRAIGDAQYKPFISADPDIYETYLQGDEDFIILACDGLWDYLKEVEAAEVVYKAVHKHPEDVSDLAAYLAKIAKVEGSLDNISVIVVFLRDPSEIASEPLPTCTMEAGFDSKVDAESDNPFANANGASILAKADPFPDVFEKNTTSTPFDFILTAHKDALKSTETNSEGSDDDHDLGPETDVDAVDDFIEKRTDENKTNKELNGKSFSEGAADEATNNIHVEDSVTFAATEAQYASVIDNEESDSEDEWNYMKGNDKENVDPSSPSATTTAVVENLESDLEVAQINDRIRLESPEEDDSMSNLNPDAAEFVPTSPTRPLVSPACKAFQEEKILSQSPKRPPPPCAQYDISLPEENDFNEDVKSKPSEIFNNGNGHMENTLVEISHASHEKETIQDDPETGSSSPTRNAGELLFGPNAGPFIPPILDQSKLSTSAVLGDDTVVDLSLDNTVIANSTNPFGENDESLIENVKKNEDPMSMSFYQGKDDEGTENPFDLNKVQKLPSDIDDFLNVAQADCTSTPNLLTTDLDKKENDLFCFNELAQSPDLSAIDHTLTAASQCLSPEKMLSETSCAKSVESDSRELLPGEKDCEIPFESEPNTTCVEMFDEKIIDLTSPSPTGDRPLPSGQDSPTTTLNLIDVSSKQIDIEEETDIINLDAEISARPKSPALLTPQIVENIGEEVKELEKIDLPIQEQTLNFAQELSNAVQGTLDQELSLPLTELEVAPAGNVQSDSQKETPGEILASTETEQVIAKAPVEVKKDASKKLLSSMAPAGTKKPSTTSITKVAPTKAASARPMTNKGAAPAPPKPQPKAPALKPALNAVTAKNPAPTSKAPIKARVPATAVGTSSSKIAEKKPLSNGDAKLKSSITKRPISGSSTTSTTNRTQSALSTTTARTTTKVANTTASTAKALPPVKNAATSSKPKPLLSTRSAATTASKTDTVTTALKQSENLKSSRTGASFQAKPAPGTVNAKPRVPISLRATTSTIPKTGPVADKKNKESMNKLTAASRARDNIVPRKPMDKDKKTQPAATKVTKTTNSSRNVGEELVNEQNAVKTIKDSSPVRNLILDNSQLAESTLAD